MDFDNIAQVVTGNQPIQNKVFEQGGIATSSLAMRQMERLLMARAMQLGVFGIQHDENHRSCVLSGAAFADTGREVWALAIQAQALMEISGFNARSSIVCVPWQPSQEEFTVGARPLFDASDDTVPASIAFCALDAAAEHALCMGIAAKGFTMEQWERLPDYPGTISRDIEFDGYLYDLEKSWASLLQVGPDGVIAADMANQIENWPTLLNRVAIKNDLSAYERIVENQENNSTLALLNTAKPEPEQALEQAKPSSKMRLG